MRLLLLVILLGLPFQVQAAIYKWVDKDGVVTFKDTPPPQGIEAEEVVPEPFFFDDHEEKDAPEKPRPSAAKETGRVSRSSSAGAKPKVTLPDRYPPVEIYTTSWCGYCVKAKNYLRGLNVPFTEYDVEKSASARARRARIDKGRSVPLTVIGGRKIVGFRPDALDQALGIRRTR